MCDQPGIAATYLGRKPGTRAQPKLEVAGHNVLVSVYGQQKITGVNDDGPIARWVIDRLDVPVGVTFRLLNLDHAGSMP
jgi:hypothetical protein